MIISSILPHHRIKYKSGHEGPRKFDIIGQGTRQPRPCTKFGKKASASRKLRAVLGFDCRVHPISECDLSTLVYDSTNQGLGL